ncbi:MAG: hypothetical protein AAGN35_21910 [Bacteroidota bacterium]
MNWKKGLLVFAVSAFVFGLVSSCAGDPRKNCNHPQHGQYMSEKMKKKRGF